LTAALRIAEVFRRAVETAALSGKEMRWGTFIWGCHGEKIMEFSGI
jgi:hypothetical protein